MIDFTLTEENHVSSILLFFHSRHKPLTEAERICYSVINEINN